MFMDGTSVREASTTTVTRQVFAQPELRRMLAAVPLSRREPAGGYGAISRPRHWSFGGQGRKPANVGVHTKTRRMEISQVCTPLREKRTCQPKLVRARSIGPGTLRALQQPPALGIASWSRLTDTASTAPFVVIDLFSAHTDLQRFFLNRRYTVRKTQSFFLMTTQFFRREFKIFCASWQVVGPRRNALATSILTLSCQKSPTSAMRNTTLGIASLEIF